MASRCIWLYGLRNPYLSKLNRVQVVLPPQARSQQSFRDGEGDSSSNPVDANMSALRCRIEQLRMRERPNSAYNLRRGHGWNYTSVYDDVFKKHSMLITSFQLITIVVHSIALVFLTGSLCIFLISFIFSS